MANPTADAPGDVVSMRMNSCRWIAVITAVVSLLFAGGCASTSTEGMVQTPAFVGLSLRDAESKAADIGLQIEVRSSESSDTMPVDFILRQDPEPQTMVRKGRIVTIVTSSGPVSVTLPDFVGDTFEHAQSFVAANKLVLGDLTEIVDKSAVGTVLRQDPPAGSDLNVGGVVTLTLSKGIMTPMPDLIGLSLTEAKKRLAAVGLSVSKVIVLSDLTQPAQLVLKQEPSANDMVEKGGWIELSVSKVP